MVTFAGLVVAHWFGSQNSLLNIVMFEVGGYVAGRSAKKWWINEKINNGTN